MDIAHQKNIANGGKNLMVAKSVSDGIEAEIFSDMPKEVAEFLIKFHNGMGESKDVMAQLKLVRKVACSGCTLKSFWFRLWHR